jgi:hypothetical protein
MTRGFILCFNSVNYLDNINKSIVKFLAPKITLNYDKKFNLKPLQLNNSFIFKSNINKKKIKNCFKGIEI